MFNNLSNLFLKFKNEFINISLKSTKDRFSLRSATAKTDDKKFIKIYIETLAFLKSVPQKLFILMAKTMAKLSFRVLLAKTRK